MWHKQDSDAELKEPVCLKLILFNNLDLLDSFFLAVVSCAEWTSDPFPMEIYRWTVETTWYRFLSK